MRGLDDRTGALFSYVDLERRVRSDHPLRAIRSIVNEALCALEREFPALYARVVAALGFEEGFQCMADSVPERIIGARRG